jgi:hypothetical protein
MNLTPLVPFSLICATVYTTWRGKRDGQRMPPMSRRDYCRSICLLAIAPFGLIALDGFALVTNHNPIVAFLIGAPVSVCFPIVHYQTVRRGVQRLRDIDGNIKIDFWHASDCAWTYRILHLCQRRGKGSPPTDPEIF